MKKLCILFCICSGFYYGGTSQPNISFQQVAGGLSSPVDVVQENFGANRLFVVEQPGTIRILEGSSFLPTPFLNVSPIIISGGERGLLSMAFHPDYATNGYFYIWYNQANTGSVTLARYTRSATDPNIADPTSGVVLLQIAKRFNNHNGAKLLFGSDGYLYFGTGDGGSAGDPDNNGQDSTTLLGKMLRIDVNNPNPPYYSIPPTNPFATSNTVRKEIVALGLRNPWRWSFDKTTGDIWLADVGQNLWEEVNRVAAADRLNRNYGWNCFEGTHSYAGCTIAANNVVPVFEYGHNNQDGGFSVTGGYVYRGTEFPSLQGYYVAADYVSGNGWLIRDNGTGGYISTLQKNWVTNITSFGEAADGSLYAVSFNGNLYKIVADEVLPLRLVSFAAGAAGGQHQVAWSVVNEDAGDLYIVERKSSANEPFTEVYRTQADVSKPSNTYSLNLPAPASDSWYRLQVKSINGQVVYSTIANVIHSANIPFRAVIISQTLQVTLPDGAQSIQVFNAEGKLLLSQKVSNSVAERISLQNVGKGILAIKVQTLKGAETVRVLYQ